MAERVTNELMYEVLKKIQGDVGHIRSRVDEHDLKIGSIAESMVGVRRDLNSMRADLRMMAIAVDEHTVRLDHIETRLNLRDA